MGQHHALRCSGGARGVQKHRHFAGERTGFLPGRLVRARDRHTWEKLLIQLEGAGTSCMRGCLRRNARGKQLHSRLAVLADNVDFAIAHARIHDRRPCIELDRREEQHDLGNAVLGDDHDAIALLHAALAQKIGCRQDRVHELLVGNCATTLPQSRSLRCVLGPVSGDSRDVLHGVWRVHDRCSCQSVSPLPRTSTASLDSSPPLPCAIATCTFGTCRSPAMCMICCVASTIVNSPYMPG